MALLDDLKWRYATKKMNGQTVPEDKLNYILEAARLAPSSSGLQPYHIFVITNKTYSIRLEFFSTTKVKLLIAHTYWFLLHGIAILMKEWEMFF